MATSGKTVHFAAGTYDATSGEDFAETVPDGVVLQGDAARESVIFAGDGQHSLSFAGSGTVRSLTLKNFGAPLVATSGTQTIEQVVISEPTASVSVGGAAQMTWSAVDLASSKTMLVVVLSATGHLAVQGGSISAAGVCGSENGIISCSDTPTFQATDTTIADGLYVNGFCAAELTRVNIGGSCGYSVYAGSGNVSLTMTDSVAASTLFVSGIAIIRGGTYHQGNGTFGALFAEGDDTKLKVRGATLQGSLSGLYNLGGNGTYDLGTASDPGSNVFSTTKIGVYNNGSVVDVAGNQWTPNVQGADSNGHYSYPAGTVITAPDDPSSKNFIGEVRF